MKNKITLLALAFPLILFLSLENLSAQYRISGAVYGGGGQAAGVNYSMTATIGQPAVGTSSGNTYQAQTGFWYFGSADVTTSVEQEDEIPAEFRLEKNYPNPFNPATTITFALPAAREVRLTIYDMLGREVATLIDGQKAAGTHKVIFEAGNLASGIYLYRLEAGAQLKIQKMTLVK